MRRFVERALLKVSRMTSEQIRSLLDILAEENERLESVLDSMIDGVIVCDTQNSLLLANKAAERLLPILGGETQGRPLSDFIDDEEISSFLAESLEGHDKVVDREFTLEGKGSRRTVAISILPLVSSGKIRGSLIRAVDVTEKRARDSRLRRAESLASLATMSANVAHEIKNPLASISIHLQLLKKSMKGKSELPTEAASKYVDVVSEEVERLNRIVVDFLFAVRPIDVEPEPTDPNEFLRGIAEFMRYELEEARISVILDLEEGVPEVPMDKRFMKQAILNLIKNAISAMPSGGSLSLSTRSAQDELRIEVADSGEGISEDRIQKIFEPYYTTRENGSGLGLTLVFKIVKEHRGEIQVQSEPGRGSAFTIVLPIPQGERKLLGYGDVQ
jgi:two-component system, sporulation sensor kinase E